jgi:DNA polymerase-3 subunit epsilon
LKQHFAIIDIETTGGRPARDKITEIAVILHDGDNILHRFESLINPEVPIPIGITELTGITNEMVREAPRFYEIARDIVEMTQGHIFVAHNVRFDYGFIQEEFRRLGYSFSRKQLCTVRLARKAFPGYRSYSLGNLIAQLQLNAGNRHRAMGDAMATADLFQRILKLETGKEQVSTMVNLGVRESLLPKNFTLEKLHEAPEKCGVYYFHDECGEVIYVGKSLNIKKRIASHFSDKTEKAAKLQDKVADVSWEVTGSELVALLLESAEIKRMRPAVNRAQRANQFPFAIRSFCNEGGYVCLEAVKLPKKQSDMPTAVLNSYSSLSKAHGWLRTAQERFELCPGLCNLDSRSGSCFNFLIHLCKGACAEQETPEDYNKRAEEAVRFLDNNFATPNFFIIDQGRDDQEQAVVLVEDGNYRGFGFADMNHVSGRLTELFDVIRPAEDNPEVRRIINRYMESRQHVKVIPF